MKKLLTIVCILLMKTLCFSQESNIQINPIPFDLQKDDFQQFEFLKSLLQNKEVVCLGESLHGVREYSEVKFLLIKYLHEELGFNILAFEDDFGKLAVANKLRDSWTDTLMLHALTQIWHTETNLRLMTYLKANPKLKLIGFDCQPSVPIDSNYILSQLFFPINKTLAEKAIAAEKEYAENSLLTDKFEALKIAFEENKEELIKFHSAEFLQLAERFIDIRIEFIPKSFKYNTARDSMMAKNVSWLINEFHQGEKVMIWAANAHIAKVPNYKRGHYMGEILKDELKDKMYAIGIYHSLGKAMHVMRNIYYENKEDKLPKNSLEYQFLKFELSSLFVNFDGVINYADNSWMKEETLNVIGESYWKGIKKGSYENKINLADSYDGLIWIKNINTPNYLSHK